MGVGIPARKVDSDIIIIRVSQRKYRIARMVEDGTGFHLGLVNFRQFELLGKPLSYGALLDELKANHADEEVIYLDR